MRIAADEQTITSEILTPAPDGVNQVFFTSTPYVAQSVAVWLNGILLSPGDAPGYTELGDSQIRLGAAPEAGDTLQAEYQILPQ